MFGWLDQASVLTRNGLGGIGKFAWGRGFVVGTRT